MSNPQRLLECLSSARAHKNDYLRNINKYPDKVFEVYSLFPTPASRIIWLCYNMVCSYRGEQLCKAQEWIYKFNKIKDMPVINEITGLAPNAENIKQIYIYSLALYSAINTSINTEWLNSFPSAALTYHSNLELAELFLNAFIKGDNHV